MELKQKLKIKDISNFELRKKKRSGDECFRDLMLQNNLSFITRAFQICIEIYPISKFEPTGAISN